MTVQDYRKANHPSMAWHKVLTILCVVAAVGFIILGAVYIGNMHFETFGIKDFMTALFEAYPTVEVCYIVLTILYGIALIYFGMERFVAFNGMLITEKGGSFFFQRSLLHTIIAHAFFMIAAACVFIPAYSMQADAFAKLALNMVFPACLIVVELLLYISNRFYYSTRNDEFIH